MTFIVHIADVSRYQREILNMQSGVHRPRKHYIIMPLKLMCVYIVSTAFIIRDYDKALLDSLNAL